MILHNRNTGKFAASLQFIHRSLAEGKTTGIMAPKETDYADRVVKALYDIYGMDVDVKVVTRKSPDNPLQMQFDKFGEPIGMEVLPQTDVFSGWLLSRKS